MKTRLIFSVLTVFVLTLVILIINNSKNSAVYQDRDSESEKDELPSAYTYYRWKYEADMIRDPVTGEVPFGLRDQEIALARQIPERTYAASNARTSISNNYIAAGPDNIGGRTRALAYDVRYNGTTNQVIIAGSVSGGMYRSTNGGTNWTRVSPANEIHNLSFAAQDPRAGSQDTWYAGGGEYVGSSTDATGALYLGHGLYKSTDNGATWSRLPLNNITDYNGSPLPAGVAERFDHPFDFVHKIAINPMNGDVYVAGHRRILRSKNGGTNFETVFGSSIPAFAANGQCDVVVSATGKVYIAMTGSAPDFSLRGVWSSPNGNLNSFTRIAGGSVLGTDSVANWRGNAYTSFLVGTEDFYDTRRTLLALAPSNENILYVLYENGLSNGSPAFNKEADLFKLDMSSGNTWTNLSPNLPDFPTGNHEATDPFAIQSGYDLFITVKPNDPNFVLLGGTSLYRSTNGFSNVSGTSWIGGYGNTLPTLSFYANSHPDIHNVVFSPNPATPNEVICANDGGIQKSNDITVAGSGVVWANLNNYQTLQYYRVTLDPDSIVNNFAGGAQDNGTQFRDKTGIVGTVPSDSNNHKRLIGGDGGSVGISKLNGTVQYLYGSVQYGSLRRGQLTSTFNSTTITPTGLTPSFSGSTTEYGEFVTNFLMDQDNTESLYYVNFNRLFRTINASLVSTASGWTELTGVSNAVNASNGTSIAIRSLALTRGPYNVGHCLYIGTTNGRIFRLDNPRSALATTAPAEITPFGGGIDISGLNVQDISVNPNNDNEILVVLTNYGKTATSGVFQNVVNILWTNNARSTAPTWKVAEGNLAGTATSGFISARSCMIVAKKDGSGNPVTEYYVGTSAGLFAVENLGTTLGAGGSPNWQREGSSTLNFAVINSLAYRPVDNTMVIGTHGNGLFYTKLGTPNVVTGINDPVINDKNFISQVFPTVNSKIVQYRIGNKPEVKTISIQVFNLSGQEVLHKNASYSNGSVDLSRFPKGAYVLSIYSDNQKYRHIQKLIR